MRGSIICNPLAGKRRGDGAIDPAVRILEDAGWSITVDYTSSRGDATRLARAAVDAGHDAVFVAGGDGTLNEAVQALAHTETALGYLPYGTVNIWARELSVPLDIAGAARSMVAGRTETVDLGMAGERYFLLMAGLGFDGEVVRRAQRLERHKGRLGVLPYLASGVTTATIYRGIDAELRYDGIIRRVQALMLVLGNTRLYGGLVRLTPQAVANDGWLDLCVVKGRGPLALARQTVPVLLSRSITYSDVDLLRVRELTVQADEPVPIQVDGELAGTTPVHFSVDARALRVIVPREFASSLIA